MVKNKLTTYESLLVGALVTNVGLLDEVIDGCLFDYSLEEIENKPVSDFNKLKRLEPNCLLLVRKLPLPWSSWTHP